MQVTEPLDGHWTDSVVPTFLAASQHQRDVFVEATSLREKNSEEPHHSRVVLQSRLCSHGRLLLGPAASWALGPRPCFLGFTCQHFRPVRHLVLLQPDSGILKMPLQNLPFRASEDRRRL